MNRTILATSASALVLALSALPVQAAKPSDPGTGLPFGNGFPSGAHFNLNLIAKSDNFACPSPEYADSVQLFGNVIFFPRVQGTDPITTDGVGHQGSQGRARDHILVNSASICFSIFVSSGL